MTSIFARHRQICPAISNRRLIKKAILRERGKRKEERGKRKEERGKRKEERGKRKEESCVARMECSATRGG
ncbi:MAG TPA: hypothetical protein DCZ48_15435 [Methylococcaceae bacterium]|nr:hypothetical protein [Methylococcaceae bacterium]